MSAVVSGPSESSISRFRSNSSICTGGGGGELSGSGPLSGSSGISSSPRSNTGALSSCSAVSSSKETELKSLVSSAGASSSGGEAGVISIAGSSSTAISIEESELSSSGSRSIVFGASLISRELSSGPVSEVGGSEGSSSNGSSPNPSPSTSTSSRLILASAPNSKGVNPKAAESEVNDSKAVVEDPCSASNRFRRNSPDSVFS